MFARRIIRFGIIAAAFVPVVAGAVDVRIHIGLQSPVSVPSLRNTALTVTIDTGNVALTGFATTGIATTNATIENLSGPVNHKYTFSVAPVSDGLVEFSIPDGAIQNTNGETNILFGPYSFTYDATPPALFLFSSTTGPTSDPLFYLATSSESIMGFVAGDIAVTNGMLSDFTAYSSTEYSFTVNGLADGLTTIAVNPGAFADLAGNSNTTASDASYGFFNLPVGTITVQNSGGSTPADFSPGTEVFISVAFSEDIDASSTVKVGITGPSVTATTSMERTDATHYIYSYIAQDGGTDVVSVDGAQDLAGNAMAPVSASVSVVRPSDNAVVQGSGSGGGGGGGGGPVGSFSQTPVYGPPAAPAPIGEVLGEQSYRFTAYLIRGMRGDEVQNLQAVLITKGFLPEDSLTGYFGAATERALKAYQAANSIAQTGATGPLTRAKLNSGLPTASPVSAVPRRSPLSEVQIDAIITLVKAFGADGSTVAAVSAALR